MRAGCGTLPLHAVFRLEQDGHSIAVLFPYTIHRDGGIHFCKGWRRGMLMGVQPCMVEETKPATPEQYGPTLHLFQSADLNIHVLPRMPSNGHKQRCKIWQAVQLATWGHGPR